MARKGRQTARRIWKRIPRHIRPNWEEFKKAVYDYGSPYLAEIGYLQAAVSQMEKYHGNDSEDAG